MCDMIYDEYIIDKMHGIKVIFKPDTEIFGDIEWNPAEVEKICGKYFDRYYSEQ